MTLADAPPPLPPTPVDVLDARLERLSARKDAWLAVRREQRQAYLRAALTNLHSVATAWVEEGCQVTLVVTGTPLD